MSPAPAAPGPGGSAQDLKRKWEVQTSPTHRIAASDASALAEKMRLRVMPPRLRSQTGQGFPHPVVRGVRPPIVSLEVEGRKRKSACLSAGSARVWCAWVQQREGGSLGCSLNRVRMPAGRRRPGEKGAGGADWSISADGSWRSDGRSAGISRTGQPRVRGGSSTIEFWTESCKGVQLSRQQLSPSCDLERGALHIVPVTPLRFGSCR